jgi:short-subunit dehydrogenase
VSKDSEIKVAIVTGASSGIGKGITQFLSIDSDYKVILIARNIDKLEIAEKKLREIKPDISLNLLSCDVADHQILKEKLIPLIKAEGRVDLLVNSAGYVKRGSSELCPDEFEKMIKTNLIGPFNLINLIVPFMKKRKRGRIINISSLSGVEARAELGGYAASKFGLMGLNDSLHQELASFGIFVTAICPNLVATEMTRDVTTIKPGEFITVEDIIKTVQLILSFTDNVMLKEIVLRNHSKFLQSLMSSHP